MAKQKGVFRVVGSIEGVTFYKKSGAGFLLKAEGGVEASRIETDPAFARTRENGREFSQAAKGGKTLRMAFTEPLVNVRNSRLTGRVTRQMLKVVKSDTIHARGERTVVSGDMLLLNHFEFNIDSTLNSTFKVPYSVTVDRVLGTLTVDIPAFNPRVFIKAPTGTTHFKIVSGGAELDFTSWDSVNDTQESSYVEIGSNSLAALSLVNQVSANSTQPLVTVLGIHFFQEVNGEYYAMNSGAFNSLLVADVNV